MSDSDLDYAIALSLSESLNQSIENSHDRDHPILTPSAPLEPHEPIYSSASSHNQYLSQEERDWVYAQSLAKKEEKIGVPLSLSSSSSLLFPPRPPKSFLSNGYHSIPSSDHMESIPLPSSGSSSANTQEDEDMALALSLTLNEESNPTISDNSYSHQGDSKPKSTLPFTSVPPSSFPTNSSNSNNISNISNNNNKGILSGLPNYLNNRISASAAASTFGVSTCNVCHEPLFGTYVEIGGKFCHPTCVLCTACGKSIHGQVHIRDDVFYHPACAEELFSSRCCLCSNKIHGKFFRNTFFQDEIYCTEHDNSRKCFSCHRKEPSTSSGREGFAELPDGRTCCMDCVTTAILDSAEARPIYQEIINFIENILHLPIPDGMRDVPILAVDMPSLNENISSAGPRNHHAEGIVRGLTLSSVGHVKYMTPGTLVWDSFNGRFLTSNPPELFKMEEVREVTAVLVLYGLPRDLTASILAHEAMHVWIRLQKDMPFYLPPKVEEGLCQVIAKKFLEYIGSNLSGSINLSKIEKQLREYFAYSIENDMDPIYGDGYRAAKKSVDELSLEVVIDHVKAYKELPIV